MEKFNPDEKMLVLMKLPANEIFVVCESSREMSQICRKEQYSNLWQNKIKGEFNIDYNGKDGYERYKFLSQLTKEKFYVVTGSSEEYPEESFSRLFDSRKKAEVFLWKALNGEYSVSAMKTVLNSDGLLKYGDTLYTLNEVEIRHNADDSSQEYFDMQEKEYEEDTNFLKNLKPEVDVKIEDFLYEINQLFVYRTLNRTKTRSKVDKFITDLDTEHKERVKSIIYKRIFIDDDFKKEF